MTTIAEAQRQFSPETAYLNTATYGLPPRSAFAALSEAADEWRHGRTGFDGWDRSVGAARATFARLAGVGEDDVAIGPAVSSFAGLVAAALPAGARVLCAEGDFTSVLFPFLAQERRGVTVELVPPERVPEALGAEHDLVAVSAVQSADGRVGDLDAVRRRRRAPRRAHVRRPDAGDGLAPGRLRAPRLRGVRRLQVAAEPARYRVLHGAARSCATSCSRTRPAGTPARRCRRPTTARRCALRSPRGASTSRPRG